MRVSVRVQLIGFQVSRALYSATYSVRTAAGKLPVRWMSPESLSHERFTAASDVYAFGVVIYELYTQASLPFAELSDEEVCMHAVVTCALAYPEYAVWVSSHADPRCVQCLAERDGHIVPHLVAKSWHTRPARAHPHICVLTFLFLSAQRNAMHGGS